MDDLRNYLLSFDPDEKSWKVTHSKHWGDYELRVDGRIVATGFDPFELEKAGRNADVVNYRADTAHKEETPARAEIVEQDAAGNLLVRAIDPIDAGPVSVERAEPGWIGPFPLEVDRTPKQVGTVEIDAETGRILSIKWDVESGEGADAD